MCFGIVAHDVDITFLVETWEHEANCMPNIDARLEAILGEWKWHVGELRTWKIAYKYISMVNTKDICG